MLSGKHFSRFVHFVPGAITLFFGMFALYCSLLLIRAHENIDKLYENQGRSIYEFNELFYHFEVAYDAYILSNSTSKDVVDKFSAFHAKFQDIQKRAILVSKSNKEYMDLLSQIQNTIQKVAVDIAAMGAGTVDVQDKELNEKIAQLHTPIIKLYRHFMFAMEERYSSDEIAELQNWLYWSVIAMGLSGFVLTLLISDKIRQLKENQEEKLKNVLLLENRLAALEAARDGIIIINNDGILTYMNHSMRRILGLEEEGSSASGMLWTKIFLEDDAEIIHEDIIPEIEENGYWTGEFPIYRSDGQVTQTDFSISRLPDGGCIATIQDISDKQRVEEEKRQLEDQFYQAQKMEAIGRLAGGIAHDFNNILAAMNGYAEFLADDLDAKTEQHGFARNILQAGKQAKELVEQMLMFSRRSDSLMENFDLVSSIRETVSMLNAGMPRTIEVVTSIVVDEAPICGNPSQISQVAMNLCVNAKDAMEDEHGELYIGVDSYVAERNFEMAECILPDMPDPKGTPMLHIADMKPGRTVLILGHLKEGKKYARLRVRDTGCGMSRTIMERIFEPFFTTKSVDKGTGLGLATVHGVIIAHQAAMVVDSTIGAGTVFDIYLPQSEENAKDVGKQSIVDAESSDAEEKGIHVLLVEDQEYVRNMTERMLERMGYTVTCAQDGLEALSMIKQAPDTVDIIITDQNMPKMTGIELVDIVYEQSPHIPFVLLSGYSEKEMRELINKHPAIKAVLKKPVAKAEFEKIMIEIVSNKQKQDAAA